MHSDLFPTVENPRNYLLSKGWDYNSAGQVDWMRYPQDNQGNPGERVDYTYHNQLTLNSVLGNFPESYALDTAYDTAGRIVRRRLGTPGTIVAQYSYYPCPKNPRPPSPPGFTLF